MGVWRSVPVGGRRRVRLTWLRLAGDCGGAGAAGDGAVCGDERAAGGGGQPGAGEEAAGRLMFAEGEGCQRQCSKGLCGGDEFSVGLVFLEAAGPGAGVVGARRLMGHDHMSSELHVGRSRVAVASASAANRQGDKAGEPLVGWACSSRGRRVGTGRRVSGGVSDQAPRPSCRRHSRHVAQRSRARYQLGEMVTGDLPSKYCDNPSLGSACARFRCHGAIFSPPRPWCYTPPTGKHLSRKVPAHTAQRLTDPHPGGAADAALLIILPPHVLPTSRQHPAAPSSGTVHRPQVYRCRLRDGTDLAVKVQRPNIGETIAVDMLLLRRLMSVVDRRLPQVSAAWRQQLGPLGGGGCPHRPQQCRVQGVGLCGWTCSSCLSRLIAQWPAFGGSR